MNDEACEDRPGILVVDDDADTAGELSELLESYGYKAWAAHSLEEAVACIDRHAPQFALIDAGLGAQCGIQLAARFLAAECPGPRVVMLSGRSPEPEDLQALGGHVPWLVKPVDLESLLERLSAP